MRGALKIIAVFAIYAAMIVGTAFANPDGTLIALVAFIGLIPLLVVLFIVAAMES